MKALITILFLTLLAGCVSSDPDARNAPPTNYSPDEHDIRMAIYRRQITPAAGQIWFVDESDSFIGELKKTTGVSEIRHADKSRFNKQRQKGVVVSISITAMSNDRAKASESYFASSAGCHIIGLRKQDGHWVISETKTMPEPWPM